MVKGSENLELLQLSRRTLENLLDKKAITLLNSLLVLTQRPEHLQVSVSECLGNSFLR